MPAEQSRPATSAAVAARAGVSRTTVSYILNGKAGVSFADETREAVLTAARELGYQPNAAARSLVARSGPVVLAISNLPHNEMSAAAVGILSQSFANRGVLFTVVQVASDLDATVDAIVALQPRAALLAFPAAGELARRLDEAGVQVIRSLVGSGSVALGTVQVDYLQERGHTRIAFADVVGSDAFGVLPRRAEVVAACAERGLPEPLAAEISRDGVGAADVIAEWHRAGVTAVCAYNDEVALAVLFGIRDAGLNCPADIAVIGCDDLPSAAVAYPPLTSVSFNIDANADDLAAVVLHELGLAEAADQLAAPLLAVVPRASA